MHSKRALTFQCRQTYWYTGLIILKENKYLLRSQKRRERFQRLIVAGHYSPSSCFLCISVCDLANFLGMVRTCLLSSWVFKETRGSKWRYVSLREIWNPINNSLSFRSDSETTPNHLCSAAFISSAAMNENVNYGLQESRLQVNQTGLPRARSRFYCNRIVFLTFSFLKFFFGSKFFCTLGTVCFFKIFLLSILSVVSFISFIITVSLASIRTFIVCWSMPIFLMRVS